MNDSTSVASIAESESLRARISREMVHLYKELFGRGPTKASTFMSDSLIVCTLEESFTPAERSMVELGEQQRLRDVRLFFQYASEDRFRGMIEEITGRKVRAFISGIDANEDVAAELFYLEPNGSGSGSTDGASPVG